MIKGTGMRRVRAIAMDAWVRGTAETEARKTKGMARDMEKVRESQMSRPGNLDKPGGVIPENTSWQQKQWR